MTGTANTEADEFNTIYGLPVTVVPTNKVVNRNDSSDCVFKLDECARTACFILIASIVLHPGRASCVPGCCSAKLCSNSLCSLSSTIDA